MSKYSSYTVPQLKDILKERSLSTAGIKNDLIARLDESDVLSNANETSNSAVEEASAPLVEESIEKAEESKQQPSIESNPQREKDELLEIDEEPSSENAKIEEEPKVEEEKPKTIKQLTPEERKTAAIELLNKKIIRAKKFGDEAAVEAAQKDLSRVEKFGVELGTSLAKEIGLANREELRDDKGRGKHFKRRGRGGFKNRGRKN